MKTIKYLLPRRYAELVSASLETLKQVQGDIFIPPYKSLSHMCLILVILFTLFASSAYAVVSTSPSSINVARGQSTTITITYLFSGVPADGILTSPQGNFLPGLGTINTPLSVTITNGRGQVSETITIPLSVVERAFRTGLGTFIYQREFPIANFPAEVATVNIRITPETIAEFSLRRIELYFNGKEKKSEAIVNRNHKGLRAYADIYFNGSGFLRGYWEVDGRVIESISRHVSFGAKVSLVTPDIPSLPTFKPGFHIIKFVMTNPRPPFELPQILYWVTAKEEPVKRSLSLLTPKDGANISPDEEFRWDKTEGIAVYLISFIKEKDRKVVFSALTHEDHYRIPQSIFPQYFARDIRYMWQIRGFDENGLVIVESESRGVNIAK